MGAIFWSKMFGISFCSRQFSSSTLMDGEEILASQQHELDDWSEEQLQSELKHLEDRYLDFKVWIEPFRSL